MPGKNVHSFTKKKKIILIDIPVSLFPSSPLRFVYLCVLLNSQKNMLR